MERMTYLYLLISRPGDRLGRLDDGPDKWFFDKYRGEEPFYTFRVNVSLGTIWYLSISRLTSC
jgi:hypothetical protein